MLTNLVILNALVCVICNAKFTDFDAMAEHWVRRKAYSIRRTVEWWELYGARSSLQKEKYKKYEVTADVCNFQYNSVEKRNDRPCSKDARHVTNFNTTNAILLNVEGLRILTDYYIWSVTDGIIMKKPVTLYVPIPTYLTSSYNQPDFNIDLQRPTNRFAIRKQKVIFDSLNYPISSSSKMKSEFSYISRESIINWSADVTFQGAVGIRYHEAYRGRYLWFYPLSVMADNNLKADGPCRLKCQVKGNFISVEQHNASMKLSKYAFKRRRFGLEDVHPVSVEYISPSQLEVLDVKGGQSKRRRKLYPKKVNRVI